MRNAPPTPRRRRTRLAVTALLAAVVALGAALPGPAPVTATTIWSRNLWVSSAFVYQDPYYTACAAASAMTMLNTIAYRRAGGGGFVWRPTRVRHNATDPGDTRDMTSILSFARKRDTLRATSAGTDAHGWRNALNAYGWGTGAMTDPALRVYDDRAYSSFGTAIKAAVRAIARQGMPVGVLAWAGGHAQVITGYEVSGADPRSLNEFTVRYLYLSDPLRESGIVNRKVSADRLRYGWLGYRFQAYRETDSPYDDPYTPGTIRSSVHPSTGPSEWYGRWVLIIPIRKGLPTSGPVPSPTPTPPPGTAPPTASPLPTDSPSPTVTPQPAQAPSPTPQATTEPSAAPEAPSMRSDPTAEPSTAPTTEPAPAG